MSHAVTRRAFLAAAASSLGASLVYARGRAQPSRVRWVERRDWFAEGVASGDPDSNSVLLWTRVSSSRSDTVPLTVEVAEDPGFTRVVASSQTRAVAAADHTCRVLVGGLHPARTYWYRFSTKDANGSRIGRTRTAAAADDPRAVSFAFVSCQNICEGSQHAYRRMIAEDERASSGSDLDFVLHLGDFVYEVVTYPKDTPDGHRYDRRLRDACATPTAKRWPDFTSRRRLATIARSTAPTCTTLTSRTRAHAGPSSRCGTTTSSRGWDGSPFSVSTARRGLRRPASYRVVHRAPLWRAGARPQLEQRVVEGDPELAL